MRQRRVGTFTLGITLVAIGIVSVLSMIYEERSLDFLRFLPIVLVALGVEILIFAIKNKEQKLIYDGLSIFFAISITVVSLGASGIADVSKKWRDFSTSTYECERYVRGEMEKNNIIGSVSLQGMGAGFEDIFFYEADDRGSKIHIGNLRNSNNDDPISVAKAANWLYEFISEFTADLPNAPNGIKNVRSMGIKFGVDVYLNDKSKTDAVTPAYFDFVWNKPEDITAKLIENKIQASVENALRDRDNERKRISEYLDEHAPQNETSAHQESKILEFSAGDLSTTIIDLGEGQNIVLHLENLETDGHFTLHAPDDTVYHDTSLLGFTTIGFTISSTGEYTMTLDLTTSENDVVISIE